MSYLNIPKAEYDFMYVSADNDTLMTFWLLEDNGSIASFAYLIGTGNVSTKCSYIAIRSDSYVAFAHYDDKESREDFFKSENNDVEEFVIAYTQWKAEIESILIGELCD